MARLVVWLEAGTEISKATSCKLAAAIESQYSFKRTFYRVDTFRNTVDALKHETIYLKSSGEQDIPLGLFDEIIQKVRSIYFDQFSNKKYQSVEKIQIQA